MKKSIVSLVLVLATVVHCWPAPKSDFTGERTWEPIFFKSIDPLAKKAGWSSLRRTEIEEGSVELRVWIGFGLAPLEAIRIRHVGREWKGDYVKDALLKKRPAEHFAIKPRSGWNFLWKRLEELGIRSLPDASTLGDQRGVRDGTSYVVEYNDGRLYRTYLYSNPDGWERPEAKKFVEIVKLLGKEFSEVLSSERKSGK